MVCKRCRERTKGWIGDNPRCAFPKGVFDSDNWNCATMGAFRDIAEDGRKVWCNDQYAAVITVGEYIVVLGWYKNRGRTEFAALLECEHMSPLDLKTAEDLLNQKPTTDSNGTENS